MRDTSTPPAITNNIAGPASARMSVVGQRNRALGDERLARVAIGAQEYESAASDADHGAVVRLDDLEFAEIVRSGRHHVRLVVRHRLDVVRGHAGGLAIGGDVDVDGSALEPILTQ